MNRQARKTVHRDRQAGLTLVEVMVALTISLLLLGGVLKVFANSKQTYRVQEALSRMQENGRFAMEFLSRDVRMADFLGCVPNLAAVTNHLDPAGAGFIDFVGGGSIAGMDGVTDSLTIRGAVGGGLQVLPVFGPLSSAAISVPVDNSLRQGDIVIVSDCVSGDIFQISNADPDTSGSVAHTTGAVTQPGNINPFVCGGGNSHCLSKVYQAGSSLYRIQTITYSIANGSGGQPALFRNVNQSGAVEMVEGVEDMQVVYGEDTGGDGAPDSYVNAAGVTDMANVVSVRVNLTLRTLEDNVALSAGNNDSRLRRDFTTTIAVRNRLP